MKKLRFSLLSLAVAAALLLPALPARAEGLELTAPSAVLMEASTGRVLFEKDPHAVRSCASITKVMTLCLVFEAIDSGRLSLDQTLTASAHAASMGGSDIWLEEGEAMSVDDLIKATVIMSANDAAVVLAEAVSGLLEDLEASKAEKSQSLSAALPASGWSGSGPYTQVVQVAGVTADTNALLDFAHAEDDAAEKTRAAAWSRITYFTPGAGTITATCLGSKPTTDLTLRIILLG